MANLLGDGSKFLQGGVPLGEVCFRSNENAKVKERLSELNSGELWEILVNVSEKSVLTLFSEGEALCFVWVKVKIGGL